MSPPAPRSGDPAHPPAGIDKWALLREVGAARSRLGLTDREVTLLQTLLSFYPETVLGGNRVDLVVFPSNKSICERLNGMASSTMRRHLAGLVASGLVARRDSPNGKRFARRYRDETEAFGFDLSPLLHRHAEICALAEEVRTEEEAHERARRAVSLMRRDLAALALYGTEAEPCGLWDRLSDLAALSARALRRKLELADLKAMAAELTAALDEARARLEPATQDMSTSDALSGQHHHNSNKDSSDSEPCLGKPGKEFDVCSPSDAADHEDPFERSREATLPFRVVLSACRDVHDYGDGAIRHWHQLVAVAEQVRPMMGISPSAWAEAVAVMGPEDAATVLAAMLDRVAEIERPGGYLRALTAKAAAGAFSPAPMVMALLRRESSQL